MIRQPVVAQLHGLIMHVNNCLKCGPTGHMRLETFITCAYMSLVWGTLQLVQYLQTVCNIHDARSMIMRCTQLMHAASRPLPSFR